MKESDQRRLEEQLALMKDGELGPPSISRILRRVRDDFRDAEVEAARILGCQPWEVRDRWRTPKSVFSWARARFGPFTLDAAATEETALCEEWYGPPRCDALKIDWPEGARVWLNPPWTMIDFFLAKAMKETMVLGRVDRVVALVPVRADQRWWHDYAIHGLITWIRGRIQYDPPHPAIKVSSASMASCFVSFHRPAKAKDMLGYGVDEGQLDLGLGRILADFDDPDDEPTEPEE